MRKKKRKKNVQDLEAAVLGSRYISFEEEESDLESRYILELHPIKKPRKVSNKKISPREQLSARP